MPNSVRTYQPLTPENAALVLIDHQVGLMTGVRDYSTGELKHNVVSLAKAARALNLPIIVTTTARDSMWGPTFPELVEALPGVKIIEPGYRLKFARRSLRSRQRARGTTRMSQSMRRGLSARPSARQGFCACCRPV